MKSVSPPRGDGSLTAAAPAGAGMGDRGPIRIQQGKSPGGGSGEGGGGSFFSYLEEVWQRKELPGPVHPKIQQSFLDCFVCSFFFFFPQRVFKTIILSKRPPTRGPPLNNIDFQY